MAELAGVRANFTGTNISAIAKGIATRMQALNTPSAQFVRWSGSRPFVTKEAQSDGCIWFADTRPV